MIVMIFLICVCNLERALTCILVENLFNTPMFSFLVLDDFSLCVWYLRSENSKILNLGISRSSMFDVITEYLETGSVLF